MSNETRMAAIGSSTYLHIEVIEVIGVRVKVRVRVSGIQHVPSYRGHRGHIRIVSVIGVIEIVNVGYSYRYSHCKKLMRIDLFNIMKLLIVDSMQERFILPILPLQEINEDRGYLQNRVQRGT